MLAWLLVRCPTDRAMCCPVFAWYKPHKLIWNLKICPCRCKNEFDHGTSISMHTRWFWIDFQIIDRWKRRLRLLWSWFTCFLLAESARSVDRAYLKLKVMENSKLHGGLGIANSKLTNPLEACTEKQLNISQLFTNTTRSRPCEVLALNQGGWRKATSKICPLSLYRCLGNEV